MLILTMTINENLTNKIREELADVSHVEEKKMFSGIAFMVNDKLCIAVRNDNIMIRIDPVLHDELVEKNGCSSMIMRGKELDGYVVVDESVLNTKKRLQFWVKLALDYNPKAKSSKKKIAQRK
jgi:TfoX/Sxy family transcriptional regulator of competence genes